MLIENVSVVFITNMIVLILLEEGFIKISEQHEIVRYVISHYITYKQNELKLYWLKNLSIKALQTEPVEKVTRY